VNGKVYLIGAGPGDPDLITVKGRDILATAEVVLYDNLAAPELLQVVPPSAQRIYVGKKKSEHAMPQREICELLVQHARTGARVIRLKGGDPYVFGRGGEEVEALAAAGIEFEVVPGVTAALGLAAYTGIPLTHREHTSSVTFVTGHNPAQIDWTRIGHSETLVIYMGLTTIGEISEKLIAAGRSPDTPAVVVQRATTPKQHTLFATLGTLKTTVEAEKIRPPATIVIGEVAALRDRLDWFGKRPMFGQTVLVTRAEGQSAETSRHYRQLGAHVIEVPVIEIQPPDDPAPLCDAIANLPSYDWIIFTSTNAVAKFFEGLSEAGKDARAIRAKVAAVGQRTADAIRAQGIRPDRVAEDAVAEGVVQALESETLAGAKVLFPRAAAGREVIPNELRKRGARVDVIAVYKTVVPSDAEPRLAAIAQVDWVTFTSPSTVKNFLALGGRRLIDAGAKPIAIGPTTQKLLEEHNLIQP